MHEPQGHAKLLLAVKEDYLLPMERPMTLQQHFETDFAILGPGLVCFRV